MTEQSQAPRQQKKQSTANNVGGITLTQPMVLIIRITLLFCTVGLALQAFLSTGDEVSCGTLSARTVCYLPGVDWLALPLMACFCFIIITYIVLSKTNK